MPRIGIGLGIGRQRFAGGFADSYSARVLADGGTIESLSCVANASTLLQQASFLFIPSGYKAGVAYSALPNNGNGDLTWTRNSTAYRTQSNGNIGSVGANVPRLSYMYGSCPSALLEPQRTNLLLRSEEFDNSTWTKLNSTITANATTSPDGNTNADELFDNSTNAVHRVNQSITIANTTNYTFTCYAKKNTLNHIILKIFDGTTNFATLFNLNTGSVVSSVGAVTASIELFNTYYRCRVTFTSTNTNATALILLSNGTIDGAGNSSYVGSGQSVYIWGAQLEVGSYATTYIPTTTASATRLTDTFTRNNIYTNGLISASGGTWFVELKNNVSLAPDRNAFGFWLGSSTTSPTASSTISFRQGGGSNRSGIWFDSTFVAYPSIDNSKIAIKWNGLTLDVFINGTKVSGSPFTFTPTLSSMQNLIGDAGRPFFIQQMALFNTPLSDSDCQLLTT